MPSTDTAGHFGQQSESRILRCSGRANGLTRIETDMTYSTADVADLLCVSQRTVRRWIKSGELQAQRTPSGRGVWRIPASEVERYQAVRADQGEYEQVDRATLYVRALEPTEDLLAHIEVHLRQYAARNRYHIMDVVRETSSGVDSDRDGLTTLRRYVLKGRIDVIVVERVDRILLAGYSEFEHWAKAADVRIEEAGIISESMAEQYAEEIIEDLFFPLADALSLAADRSRAEQATARVLAEAWRFLDLEGSNVRPDALVSEMSARIG